MAKRNIEKQKKNIQKINVEKNVGYYQTGKLIFRKYI